MAIQTFMHLNNSITINSFTLKNIIFYIKIWPLLKNRTVT